MTTLEQAFARLADFETVQAGRSFDELVDAVKLLQESVGIDDEARVRVREMLERRRVPDGTRGPVLMGLILGLMAAQLEGGGAADE